MSYQTHSVSETMHLGKRLARRLPAGSTLGLTGDLGSGKTHFTKGLAQGLEITEMISSPTFVLHRRYATSIHGAPLYFNHLDLYRIEAERIDIDTLGFDLDALLGGQQITVIEWAERIRALLPADTIWLHFTQTSEQVRTIEITPDLLLVD